MPLTTQAYLLTASVEPQAPSPLRLKPVRNYSTMPWNKPQSGGLWTSTWVDDSCAWRDFCVNEMDWGDFYIWLLEPDPRARILEIDTLDDLKDVLLVYPDPRERGQSLGNVAGVNFEAIAESWDGIHLTEEGQWRTRLSQPNLYGWDVESTLWFRWCFLSVRNVAEVAQQARAAHS